VDGLPAVRGRAGDWHRSGARRRRHDPTPEAQAVGEANLWSFDRSLDEFFAEALSMPGFRFEGDPVGVKVWYATCDHGRGAHACSS